MDELRAFDTLKAAYMQELELFHDDLDKPSIFRCEPSAWAIRAVFGT